MSESVFFTPWFPGSPGAEKGFHSMVSMAEAVLFCLGKLSEGVATAGRNKERIVTESPCAAFPVNDPARRLAVTVENFPSVLGQDERATETSGALFAPGSPFFEFAQEEGPVGGVAGFVSGKSRRVHAWGAIEGIDLKSGIVGEDPLARAIPADGEGFQPGILEIGGSAFFNLRQTGESGQIARSEGGTEEEPEFPGLVSVARCNKQVLHLFWSAAAGRTHS